MKKFTNGELVEMTAEEVTRFEKMRKNSTDDEKANERIAKLEAQIAALLAEKEVVTE